MQSYFSRLNSEEQRRAYQSITRSLENKYAYAEVRCTEGDVLAAYEAAVMDHPNVSLWHPIICLVYNGRSVELRFIGVDEGEYQRLLDKKVAKIAESFRKVKDKSAYALYKVIYDEIAKTVSYDGEALASYIERKQNGVGFDSTFFERFGESFSPYGALVKKNAVCNGIAKLYQILCQRFSLPCACVQARQQDIPQQMTDTTSCDHLLNVVEVDGVQSFVDVTAGLPQSALPMITYDYFMVNYEVLKKRMSLRPGDERLFLCNGPNNLYFERSKLVFTSLNALTKYLAGYIFNPARGGVSLYYRGGLEEEKLKKICEDVLSAHCSSAKTISGVHYEQGFCNCAIIDAK